MADGYDGHVKIGIDMDIAEATKKFDKLWDRVKSDTEEITKVEGDELREFVENLLSSVKEITPEMEKVASSLLRQADIIDRLAIKQGELALQTNQYKTNHDKLTESIYKKQLEIDKVENQGLQAREQIWADYQKQIDDTTAKLNGMRNTYTQLEANYKDTQKEIAISGDAVDENAIKREKRLKIEMQNLEIEMGNVNGRLEQLKEEFAQVKMNPALAPKLAEIGEKFAILQQELERLETQRYNLEIEATTKLTDSAHEIAVGYEQAHNNANGLSYTLATLADETEEVDAETGSTERHSSRIAKLFVSILNTSKRIAGKFREMSQHHKATHKATNLLDRSLKRLYRRIVGLARRVFIFSVITKALRKIRSLLSNIFKSDNEMADYFSKIKANLLTAFAPLWDAIVPIFKTVLQALVSATATLAKVMSALFGRTVKSSQDSAKALEEQAKATDKTKAATDGLNKSLGHLDELNTDISTENANADEDSGSGLTYEDMEISQEMLDKIERLKSLLSDLFDPLRKSWEKNKGKLKASVKRTFEELKRLAGDVGSSFMEVWTNGTAEEAFDHIFGTVTNLVDTVGNLADNFADAWEKGDRGTSIVQHIGDIFNTILGHVESITQSLKDWSATLDFEPILTAFDDLLVALDPFIDITLDGLQWIFDNLLLPLATWAIESAIPATLEAISGAFEAITAVLIVLKPYGDWLWQNFLKPIADLAGGIVVSFFETLGEAFKDLAKFIKDNKEPLETFIKLFTVLVGPVGLVFAMKSGLKAVSNLMIVLGGKFTSLATLIASPAGIVVAIGLIVAALVTLGGKGEEVIEDIMGVFGSLIEFLSDAFKGDWEAVLVDLLNIGVHIVNLFIDLIEGLAKGMAKAFSSSGPFGTLMKFIDPNAAYSLDVASQVIDSWGLGRVAKIDKDAALGRIAQGQVVPTATKTFLANLDKNGKSPEDSMDSMDKTLTETREMLARLLNNQEEQAQMDKEIVIEVDGNQLFNYIVKQNKLNYLQTGQNMLIY